MATNRRPAAKRTRPSAKSPAAGAKPAKRPRPATQRGPAPRRAAQGDTPPVLDPAAIEEFTVEQAGEAADETTVGAIRDLLEGTSPSDAVRVLRSVLEQQRGLDNLARRAADRELADNWQEGGYPYKNLLSRKSYERQKYRLQVELLKLQAWAKETGQRVIVLFEGRDSA